MKIIVCGAGPVGVGIARQLASEDNSVVIIDSESDAVRKMNDSVDISALHGFPSHPSVLEDAGAKDAEMIIAVTTSDEVNMTICQIAHSLFNVPIKVARIRHQNYLDPIWKDLYRKAHLPIDFIISPEREVANAIINRLHIPGAMDTMSFADNAFKVIEIRCSEDNNALGKSIEEIYSSGFKMSIIAINREGNIIIPNEKEIIKEGDEVFFIADTEHVHQIMIMFGYEEQEARRVLIVGGGNIGLYIGKMLEEEGHGISAKVIEIDKERAEFAASNLNQITVINGNALDREILQEANVEAVETVISVTDNDQVNILTSLICKKSGASRSFVLINNSSSYGPLISQLGIDVTVSPREMTVSTILQHTRSGKVWAANTICAGKAEIIEAEIVPHSAVIGNTIRDVSLPKGIIVGAILRGVDTIIPDQDTIIAENDHLIICCLTSLVTKVDKIFSKQLDYF